MSILRNVDPDGTKYYFEEDGKLTVKHSQDTNVILKKNKQLYNQGDSGYNAGKDMKRVASIPTLVLTLWTKEYNGTNNWFGLPQEVRNKILKQKLNSSDYKYFRTASGRF